MELIDKLLEKARLGEKELIDEIHNNKELIYKIVTLENNKIISIYEKNKKFPNIISEMEFNEKGKLISPNISYNKHLFVLYERLSIEEKAHLGDFTIINAIRCSAEKNLTQEEQENLFSIIEDVSKNEFNETDPCRIADEIVKAYEEKEISMDVLQKCKSSEILDCIVGIGDFELLEEYKEEEME